MAKNLNINWYKNILEEARIKNCIINFDEADNDRTYLLLVNNKRYLYRAWKIDSIHYILEAMYVKNRSGELKVLEDKDLRKLYNELEELGIIISNDDIEE